jgi:hypothetical protein
MPLLKGSMARHTMSDFPIGQHHQVTVRRARKGSRWKTITGAPRDANSSAASSRLKKILMDGRADGAVVSYLNDKKGHSHETYDNCTGNCIRSLGHGRAGASRNF